MPEYKRKKHNKFSPTKKSKPKKVNITFNDKEIEKEIEETSSLKVVKGKRLIRKRKIKITLGILLFLFLTIIILSAVLPVGLGENITNLVASMGSGEYPVKLSGSEVLSSDSKGSYYYVLTDTNLTSVSKSGKQIYDIAHGFLRPVLKTSETRALIFDQGGNTLSVYNLKERVNSYTTENRILTASISRDGTYAVVTTSDEYTSVVEVFDKDGKQIFKWNSAKDMVNNVAVSRSGDYIAVSTVNGYGGQLDSNVYILGFDSADYKYKLEIKNSTVLSLSDCGDTFSVVSDQGLSFIDWEENTKSDYNTNFDINLFRKNSEGIVAVLNLENNRTDNKIITFNFNGEKLFEFDFSGVISDIYFDGSHIYCINESKIIVLQTDGKTVSQFDCGFGTVKIVPVSADTVIAVTDTDIKRLEINN